MISVEDLFSAEAVLRERAVTYSSDEHNHLVSAKVKNEARKALRQAAVVYATVVAAIEEGR